MASKTPDSTVYLTEQEADRIRNTAEARLKKCSELAGHAREPRDEKGAISQATGASLMADMGTMTETQGSTLPALVVGQPYPPCTVPLRELQLMKVADLQLETHHRGRQLTVKRVSPVVTLTTRSWTMVQDEAGETERLEIVLHTSRHGEDILESTRAFALKEPYFTLTEEGEPTLRIDHPSDLILDPPATTTATPPPDVEKRATSLKAKGNTALSSNNPSLAHTHYTTQPTSTSYPLILSALITASPSTATSDPDLVAACAAAGSVPLLTQLWQANPDLDFTRPDRFGWTPLALARQFARRDAEAFLTRQAVWRGLLPRRWGKGFPCGGAIAAGSVQEDGTRVVHTSGRRVCVSAERPLPDGLEGYYFEVELLEVPGGKGEGVFPEMAVGFCTLGGAAITFPGWWGGEAVSTARSWGYHSDTGRVYSSVDDRRTEEDSTLEESRYQIGDTVGAGVDLRKGEIWFTRNGVKLETVVKGVEGRLFPVVGLHEEICFETNFGREGDGEFKWKPEKNEQQPEETAVVKLVVLDGKEDDKTAAVQVTTQEVVVVEAN